jgi:hypothetical protein
MIGGAEVAESLSIRLLVSLKLRAQARGLEFVTSYYQQSVHLQFGFQIWGIKILTLFPFYETEL